MHWRFSLSWFRQILVSLNRFWVLTGKCFEITIRHHNLANAQITRNAPRTGRATNTFWFRTFQNRSFCSGSLIIFFFDMPMYPRGEWYTWFFKHDFAWLSLPIPSYYPHVRIVLRRPRLVSTALVVLVVWSSRCALFVAAMATNKSGDLGLLTAKTLKMNNRDFTTAVLKTSKHFPLHIQ